MMTSKTTMSEATTAKLLLVALSFCWGLSWTAMRVALDEVSPWAMRLIGYSIGAVTLLILLKAQRRSLTIPAGKDWLHIVVAALFLAVAFGVAGTFAQLMANTSRVIIVNYSMPVWSSLMAYFVLRERINMRSALGLVLCVIGLGVLVYPVAEQSMREPIGLLLAFCCALGWGGGTVYMKWARIKGDLLAITFWQVMVGVAVFADALPGSSKARRNSSHCNGGRGKALPSTACSAPASPISSGSTSSAGCRPRWRRSAR